MATSNWESALESLNEWLKATTLLQTLEKILYKDYDNGKQAVSTAMERASGNQEQW